MPSHPLASLRPSFVACALLLLTTAAGATIDGANDLRLSDKGGSGTTVGGALNSAVAYNSTAREWLVVWEGSELDPATEQLRIYGQRVDAVVGAEIGANDFLIAEVAGGPDPDLDARQPAVAYSPTADIFLVVYTADVNATTTEIDVFGQLVNGDGTLAGSPFLVGDCGAPGDTLADVGVTIGAPLDIVYNATDDEFAVVYRCDDVGDTDSNGDGTPGDVAAPVNGDFDIFFQIVSSAGALGLNNDVQVSFAGGTNGTNIEFDAESPTVAWNSTSNEYLVVWGQDTPVLGDGNREIFARRVSSAGVPNGTEFKVSTTAHAGTKDSVAAHAAYNPDQDEYLVVWSGDIAIDGEVEVFAQRVNANATLDGGNFAVSQNGTATNGAGRPRVVYNTLDDQYMVSWQASTATVGELEIFVQRLTTTGSAVGPNDLRVSDIGANTNTSFDVAQIHDLAWAGAPLNTYIAVWDGDDNRGGQVDDELEVYGQHIEPVLEVLAQLTSVTTDLDAEDTLSYLLTVRHKQVVEGADTHDASLRDALQVRITGDVPAELENVQIASAQIRDGATDTDVSANFSIDGSGDLVTDTPFDLNQFTNGSEHERLEIVVTGRLVDTVSPDDVIPAHDGDILWRNRVALDHPEYDDADSSATATIVDPYAVTKAANVAEAVIGQEITYTVTATVVEGTTTNLQWVDTLPANVTYIGGSLSVTNANGMTISGLTDNGGPAGSTLTIDATSVVNPGDADGPGVTDTDAFAFTYRVRVNNVAANQNATMLTNDVDSTADSVAADNDNQATVTVREPVLAVTKVANDTTPTYGQTVTYTVTLTHSGSTADAFDLVVVDTLPAGLTYVAASVSGATLTSQVGQTLTFDAGDLTLGAGSKMFTYQATVAAEGAVAAGAMLTNNQAITWTSLDGASAFERTGADGPGGALNDYATTSSETVTVTVPNLSTSSKAVSDAVTGDNDGLAQAGETIRYTITVTNTGNGAATSVVVTDAPPAHTALDVGSVTTSCGGGTVTTGNTGGDTSVQVDVPSLAGASSCTVAFDVVVDDPVAAGVTQISNSGSIASAELATVTTNIVNTTVDADPVLSTSAKAVSDMPSGNNDGQAQAGETLTWTITVTNSGDQGATNVVVTDAAPTGTTFDTGSVTTSCGGATITTGNGGGDTSLQVDVPILAGASSCTVTFEATVDDPLAAGLAQICNVATVDSDETAAGDTNNACLAIDGAPDLSTSSKAVSDAVGNNDSQAQPGETLTWTVTVTNSGDQDAANVVVTDAPPTGTTHDAGSVMTTCPAATITTGNGGGDTSVQVDVPVLAGGGGSCSVTFTVTVDDPLAGGLAQVCNAATIDDDVSMPLDTNTVCLPVDAEPVLATSSLAVGDPAPGNNDGSAQPGEMLTYTLSLANTGDQGATNVVVTDAPPANTSLAVGSVASTCPAAALTTGNGGGDTTVRVDVPELAGAASCTVTWRMTVDSPLAPAVTQITNSAEVVADGIARLVIGADPRTADKARGAKFATNDTIIPVDASVSLASSTKTVADDSADSVVQPGETLTYTITAINSGNQAAANVVITDAAPVGSTFDTGSVATDCPAATITTGNGGGDTSVRVDVPSLAGSGGSCTVTFTVTASATPDPMQSTIDNTAQLAADSLSAVDSTTASLPLQPMPVLVATKSVVGAAGSFSVGDTVTYEVAITNVGSGTQPDNPTDEMTDVLPPELTLVSASASAGTATASVMTNTVTWNGSLASGATVTVTIEATIATGMPGDQIANQAEVFYDNDANGSNESSASSDDPSTGTPDDPTLISLGSILDIPTSSTAGLALLAGLLALVAWRRLGGS